MVLLTEGARRDRLKIGDIFEEDVEALVNSVNCVGVMGRGIALQFKNRFPENFKAYAAACKRDEVKPGRMFIHESGTMTNPRYIVNFPTKRHWRGKSRMEDIEAGLADLAREIKRRNIRSIAIPPLGSSLGKLDWADVRPRMNLRSNRLMEWTWCYLYLEAALLMTALTALQILQK